MKYKGKVLAYRKPEIDGSITFIEFIDLGHGQEFASTYTPITILGAEADMGFLQRMNPDLDFDDKVLLDVEIEILNFKGE